MRYALAIAGLAVAAQAGNTYTLTATEEVTITSCAPTHTNCPYKSGKNEWENWSSADPTTWASWDPSKSTTTSKPNVGTSTWGSWDPSKPSTTTTSRRPNGDDNTWGSWDPSKPSTTSKPNGGDNTWGSWDPSKPSTTGKPNGGDNTWGSWDPSKSTTTSRGSNGNDNTWGSWDPSKSTKTSSTPAGQTGTWGVWTDANGNTKTSSKTPDAATGTWSAWSSSSTAACPSYTATAPPAWFSQLPSSVLSSLAAKWTGAPPSDWCYYSYSASTVVTKTPDAATGASSTWATWADATGTGKPVAGVSGTATGTGQIAKYTGAANANAASFVLGGAAAIAAVILV